ncbi:unnamed protein product, partial [Candidula unifasciata]
VVFGFLQARDRGCLCWQKKPNYIPDWNKSNFDGVAANFAMQDRKNEESSTQTKIKTHFPQSVTAKCHKCTNTAQHV